MLEDLVHYKHDFSLGARQLALKHQVCVPRLFEPQCCSDIHLEGTFGDQCRNAAQAFCGYVNEKEPSQDFVLCRQGLVRGGNCRNQRSPFFST